MYLREPFLLAVVIALAGCGTSPVGDGGPNDAAPGDHAESGSADVTLVDGSGLGDARIDVAADGNRPIDATSDVQIPPPSDSGGDGSPAVTWCSLGTDVAGAIVPAGFCMRQFAAAPNVTQPRTLTFAPNGDLFVGSPSNGTPGGGGPGAGAILVLFDDNHDGQAEVQTFLPGVPDVHALALSADTLYYTVSNGVMQTPYTLGQRTAGTSTRLFTDGLTLERFTHGLAFSTGGTLYYTYSTFAVTCPSDTQGAILDVTSGSAVTVASGFRNPMYVRCHAVDDVCLATELGDDGGGSWGAHEKLLAVRASTNYGFPCCATTSSPASMDDYPCCAGTVASCASVTTEEVQFPLNDTPFGLDWERGAWPAPYGGVVCVAKHGSFYSNPPWQGAGVFCATTDAITHVPNAPFQVFIGGFSSSGPVLARPADVAFAPDGRMFVADDLGNAIYWIAPTSLRIPSM